MTYQFSCVDVSGRKVNDLIDMIDNNREITAPTFKKNAGIENYRMVEGMLGYPCGDLRLNNDYAVTFHKSKFQGRKAYYVRHSAIEYVFY